MKNLIKAINIGGYILIGIAFFKIMQIRFANAHLTETQMFLSEWDAWLAIVAMCIAGYLAATAKET